MNAEASSTSKSPKLAKIAIMIVIVLVGLFSLRSCGKTSPLDGQYYTRDGNLIKFGSFGGSHHVVYAVPYQGHYKHNVFLRWEYDILSNTGNEFTLLCTEAPLSSVIQKGYRVVVTKEGTGISIKTESGNTVFDGTFVRATKEEKIEYGL